MIGTKDAWKGLIDKIIGMRNQRQQLEQQKQTVTVEAERLEQEEARALREARELELRKAAELLEAHRERVFPPLAKAVDEATGRFDAAMAKLQKEADGLWDAYENHAREARAFLEARAQTGLTEFDVKTPHLDCFHRRDAWNPLSQTPLRREWDGGLGSLITSRLRRLRYLKSEEAANGKRG